jgi:hypothetical protein
MQMETVDCAHQCEVRRTQDQNEPVSRVIFKFQNTIRFDANACQEGRMEMLLQMQSFLYLAQWATLENGPLHDTKDVADLSPALCRHNSFAVTGLGQQQRYKEGTHSG